MLPARDPLPSGVLSAARVQPTAERRILVYYIGYFQTKNEH